MKPKRKKFIIGSTVGCVIFACLAPVGLFGFYIAASLGSDAGSPVLATEWAKELEAFDNGQNRDSHESSFVLEGKDGSWLVGRARGSHGIWKRGGGTIVVRDNKEVTRYFSGHVCSEGLKDTVYEGMREYPSVGEFLDELVLGSPRQFVERTADWQIKDGPLTEN